MHRIYPSFVRASTQQEEHVNEHAELLAAGDRRRPDMLGLDNYFGQDEVKPSHGGYGKVLSKRRARRPIIASAIRHSSPAQQTSRYPLSYLNRETSTSIKAASVKF